MSKSSKNNLSRRKFITTATAGAAVLGVAGSKSASGQPKSVGPRQKRVRWRFQAQRIEDSFLDGSTLPFFRYVAVGTTRSNGRVPLMQERENRNVSVSIENLVDFPIQPTILNYATGPVIMPQETGVWDFIMPPEGTWIFTEALLERFASSAGFAAAVISNPESGATNIRDYFLMYQDADDRWNNAIDNGNVPDESVFEPNYHTLNGITYPMTLMDNSTRLSCNLGEQVLIRLANLSNIRQILHFHGYHVDILTRDNKPETTFPEKDTISLEVNSTTEVLLNVTQTGEYPVHPHSLTGTTDNGLYQGGSVTMIDAQDA